MALQALHEFVKGPSASHESEAITGGRGLYLPPEAGAEVSELLSAESVAEMTAGVVELRNLMPGGDLFHSSVLALMCGTLVENGADPGAAIDATMDLFLEVLDALAEQPDEMVRAAGQLTFMATMTMLSRSKETRKRWRAHPRIIERLDDLEDSQLVPWFLREIFTLHDDLELLVLDPKNRRAFEFRLTGVRDRLYHAYALLQDALLQHTGPGYLDAEPVDPAVVRYARNHALTQAEFEARTLLDHQRFNFTFPGGLFMPGSGSPFELPLHDGRRVLVVEPKGIHFGWNPADMYGIAHQALKASADLTRELDPAAAEALLARCGLT
ncbi:hypothetical protein ACIP5Y_43780 [Nocardia sp. NPDC088792]|uniref:hypothetical protein n=1 Tax=Nocardia sp. NPDC088792 TaxID=3364332 RepID=UPI00381B3850